MKSFVSSAKSGKFRAREREFLRPAACWLLAAQLVGFPVVSLSGDSVVDKKQTTTDPVLKTMQGELARASQDLAKADPPPYFLSYTVYDQDLIVLVSAYGSLLTDASLQRRQADVTMRVGSPTLDNTHGQSRGSGVTSGTLPQGENPDALARVLWELTDREYKRAAPAFLNVKTNTAVRAEEEDKSPDFSKETSVTHLADSKTPPAFDRSAWEGAIRRISAAFRKYPHVYFASVVL